MYIPEQFRIDDTDAMLALIARHPFALLVTTDGDGAPFATHLPLLHEADGDGPGRLLGHVARANPQWRHFAPGRPVLAVFSGPHAYISPNWYENAPAVPTWNYLAVHAYGRARLIEDRERVRAQQRALVEHFEAGFEEPWRMELPAKFEEGMLNGIVAFEIAIERLEGKAKLSQNRPPEDQRGVHAAMAASPFADGPALAGLMAGPDFGNSLAD